MGIAQRNFEAVASPWKEVNVADIVILGVLL